MNLSVALNLQAQSRNTDDYRQFYSQQADLRYKKIFSERPYQGAFS